MNRSNTPPRGTPDPAELLLLDKQLCFALYSASHAMTRLYQPMLADLGLTYPQYLALLVLWEQDSLTVSDIGARLSLDSGTLTPLLKRMEAGGLITRLRDAADERRVVIRLTPAGRRLKSKAAAIPACLIEATGCSLDDVLTLTRQIQALKARLQA